MECGTHRVSEIHLRYPYVCKGIETICFHQNGITECQLLLKSFLLFLCEAEPIYGRLTED